MKNKKSDKNFSGQLRVDPGLHQLLKARAKSLGMSIKTLLEGYIADGLYKDRDL